MIKAVKHALTCALFFTGIVFVLSEADSALLQVGNAVIGLTALAVSSIFVKEEFARNDNR